MYKENYAKIVILLGIYSKIASFLLIPVALRSFWLFLQKKIVSMCQTTLKRLFQEYTGEIPHSITQITAAGSNRVYYRIKGGAESLIGVVGTNIEENRAFFEIDERLSAIDLPVPKLLTISEDKICYLQQDLGEVSLYDYLSAEREQNSYSASSIALLRKVMHLLSEIQFRGGEMVDFNICYPSKSFDERAVRWDLNYFKYCFLKATGIEFNESLLEDEFDRMVENLLTGSDIGCNTLMYRDFQARNVMVRDGAPWFIDFQGARLGPIEYDVASFLWQARAKYPEPLRQELIECYLEGVKRYADIDEKLFKERLNHFVLFRVLQVFGAYGFRGYFEQKLKFVNAIPSAILLLKQILKNPIADYPYLNSLLHKLTDLPRYAEAECNDRLKVRVFSFSYRRGIPTDYAGNGGGFVFDCRFLTNPGLYKEYKDYRGIDAPVIEFLDRESMVSDYLSSLYSIVEGAVESYQLKGYTDLMVSFGCTGGRHRSVYSAQHMAEYLHSRFADSIVVELVHRELGLKEIL